MIPSAVRAAAPAPPAYGRAGAHLADFPLRLREEATAAPRAGVARPEAGEAWTLAQTLQELRLRRVALVETSRGLRVRHASHAEPALVRAVQQHDGPLRTWRRLGVADGRGPAEWAAAGWDDVTRLHAAWFGLAFTPPALPLALRPGVRITDWPRFRVAMAEGLALGPGHPAAARVAGDLAALYERFGAEALPGGAATRRPSLAA